MSTLPERLQQGRTDPSGPCDSFSAASLFDGHDPRINIKSAASLQAHGRRRSSTLGQQPQASPTSSRGDPGKTRRHRGQVPIRAATTNNFPLHDRQMLREQGMPRTSESSSARGGTKIAQPDEIEGARGVRR